MSRPGQPAARNLTLTEELERLEQSITLTLQEIDHNFSKAHRIVTTSILPLVEQYGEHSKAVWDASKFWKQFFEASANVSLSGYEELAGEQDESTTAEDTALPDQTADYSAVPDESTVADRSAYEEEHANIDADESLMLDDAEMSGSTPRPPATKSMKPQIADFSLPYEKLRHDLKKGSGVDDDTIRTDVLPDDDETMELPAQTATTRLPDMTMTPRSSSILQEPTLQLQQQRSGGRKAKDPLLHRVLDKNYRIQATPHKNVSPQKGGRIAEKDTTRQALWADSPMSSPEMAVPKLRSDLYMSPTKGRGRQGGGAPRTPGVSVQTPTTAKKRDVFADETDKGKGKAKRDPDEITWESDEDDETGGVFGGMSPPKTIQFAMPQSRLMQTPGKCY
jgi:DASH complex subunit ASK1